MVQSSYFMGVPASEAIMALPGGQRKLPEAPKWMSSPGGRIPDNNRKQFARREGGGRR